MVLKNVKETTNEGIYHIDWDTKNTNTRYCQSTGRNGSVITTGIGIEVCHLVTTSGPFIESVIVRPINSRGETTDACRIEVPAEAWPGDALTAILNHAETNNLLPAFMGLHPLADALIERRLKKTPVVLPANPV
jgi:hypothetical protein